MASLDDYMKGMFIDKKKENDAAQKYVDLLRTKTPGVDQLVVNLSGGNQQKVVIAKWLVRNCDILIFDEPTRGIDVGAKSEIYQLMNELVAEGKSIIMVSSEMTEILRMSDRIVSCARDARPASWESKKLRRSGSCMRRRLGNRRRRQ